MKLSKSNKIEKVVASGKGFNSRPALEQAYLKVNEDGTAKLYATDSYKLVAIDVDSDDVMQEGYVPIDAIKESRKHKGQLDVADSDTVGVGFTRYQRMDKEVTQFIRDPQSLIPKHDPENYSICFNAKYLYELAQAMGSDEIRLEITKNGDGSIGNRKPFRVETVGFNNANESEGVIMPVRNDR